MRLHESTSHTRIYCPPIRCQAQWSVPGTRAKMTGAGLVLAVRERGQTGGGRVGGARTCPWLGGQGAREREACHPRMAVSLSRETCRPVGLRTGPASGAGCLCGAGGAGGARCGSGSRGALRGGWPWACVTSRPPILGVVSLDRQRCLLLQTLEQEGV